MDFIENKKKKEILSAARKLFWKYGFRRVSVEEICREADVSKMTFYRFFSNKIDLAKSVFDNEMNEGLKKFKALMAEESSPADKIRKMLLMKMEGTNEISKEFLNDFYTSNELGLKSYVNEKTRQAWNEIISDFKKAQEDGWIRKDLKIELLVHLSFKISELVTNEEILKLFNTPQELIMEVANFYAYGISTRK